jgi:hypothetical protein
MNERFCRVIVEALDMCAGSLSNFPHWDGVYRLVIGTPLPLSSAKSRKQAT